jgi:hypothetical protein
VRDLGRGRRIWGLPGRNVSLGALVDWSSNPRVNFGSNGYREMKIVQYKASMGHAQSCSKQSCRRKCFVWRGKA